MCPRYAACITTGLGKIPGSKGPSRGKGRTNRSPGYAENSTTGSGMRPGSTNCSRGI